MKYEVGKPLAKVVVREVVAPPGTVVEVWHGRPGSSWLVREEVAPPGPTLTHAEIVEEINETMGKVMDAMAKEDQRFVMRALPEAHLPIETRVKLAWLNARLKKNRRAMANPRWLVKKARNR